MPHSPPKNASQVAGSLFGLTDFQELFVQNIFIPRGVGVVLVDHFSFAVEEEGVGDVHHIHGALELAVLVNVHFIFPAVAQGNGADFGTAAGIVDRDSHEFDPGFGLPVEDVLVDGGQLFEAGFAPDGPKADDHGLPIVVDGRSIDGASVEVFEVDGWEGGFLGK